VASGLSLVLGVLRIPNVAHGSLYMIGAFLTYSVATLFGQSTLGFWLALIAGPAGRRFDQFFGGAGTVLPPVRTRAHDAAAVHVRLLPGVRDLVKLIWGARITAA
jgi:branched-chain amino acid transport system permease protein